MNHDRIGELYDGTWGSPEGTARARARIHWLCRHAEGPRVLDVGCSQGIASILLAREGNTVTGIDRESVAIEAAQERLAAEEHSVRRRISFVHTEVAELERADPPFDSALLGEVLEHQVDPRAVLDQVSGLVTPGGAIVLSTPYGLLPYHDHKDPVYLGMLVEILSDSLQLDRIELVDRYMCAVIRVLGAGDAVAPPPFEVMLGLAEERLRLQDQEVVRLAARHAQARDQLKAAGAAEAEQQRERAEQLNEARLSARTHRMHRERLESEREGLQRDVDARDAHLRELRKLAQDHEQAAAVARAELSVLERRLTALEKEGERLSGELAATRRSEAEARVAEQRADAARGERDRALREAEARAAENAAARESLAHALEEAQAIARAASAEITDRVDTLDAELRAATARLAEAVRRRDEAEHLMTEARQKRRSLHQKLDRRDVRIATLTAQLEEQRDSAASASAMAKRLDAVVAEHAGIEARLQEREQLLGRLTEERDALGAQLEDVREAAAELARRDGRLRTELREANEQALRLKVERGRLAELLETQDTRLETAEQRVRELAAELDHQTAAAATASAQVEQLRAAQLARSA